MENKIKIVENNICVDIQEIKKIIIDEWLSGEFAKFAYEQGFREEDLYKSILEDIAAYANDLSYKIRVNTQEKLGRPNDMLDWYDLYPKSDVRSIGFEVLNFLDSIVPKSAVVLTTEDIPAILEFLDTPPNKSLETWDKSEKYWKNLDYQERQNKLLQTPIDMNLVTEKAGRQKSYIEKTSYQY